MGDQAEWAVALDDAILAALQAMRDRDNADWSVQAGDLEWDCRATVRHIAGLHRLRRAIDFTAH